MLTLNSQLTKGKYKGLSIRRILHLDPQFLYDQYILEPELDLHLDVMRAMEKKGFNMRRAALLKMKSITQDI